MLTLIADLLLTMTASTMFVAAEDVPTAIVSTHSYLCLDNSEGSKDNGNELQQFACVADDVDQQWSLRKHGDIIQIVNAGSGKCLDQGGSFDKGGLIWQWDCHSSNRNQAWKLRPKGSGTFEIVSALSGKCMDVKELSKDNHGAIHQWDCHGNASQKFWLSTNKAILPAGSFDFATKKVRGVNLGGWLVLESWLTPSLFEAFAPEAKDEWRFCQTFSNKSAAKAALTRHWDSWVTENDIKTLASYGLNFLRIPIGYWAVRTFSSEPFISGPQIGYMKKAIRWAKKYGLHVIIDLHGTPGFQNSFDSSGHESAYEDEDEKPDVQFTRHAPSTPFADSNIVRTITVIAELARIFTAGEFLPTVASIQLVDEPVYWLNDMDLVKQYYATAYAILRANTNVNIMLDDAFLGENNWNNFMRPPFYQNVVMDSHKYQAFGEEYNGWTGDQHLEQACKWKREIAQRNAHLWTIVGEWSGATKDFFKTAKQQPGYRAWLREYIEKQMSAYESGSGWVFWNFKTEEGYEEWNYMLGVREGWIPNPANARIHSC